MEQQLTTNKETKVEREPVYLKPIILFIKTWRTCYICQWTESPLVRSYRNWEKERRSNKMNTNEDDEIFEDNY